VRNGILSAQLFQLELVTGYERNQLRVLSGMRECGQNRGLGNVAQADNCIPYLLLAVHAFLPDQ
jgi:hypothetical protein